MGCKQSIPVTTVFCDDAEKAQQQSVSNTTRDSRSAEFSCMCNRWQDDYVIVKKIGEGSISNIFQVAAKGAKAGQQEKPAKIYALKQLDSELADSEAMEEMMREFKLLQSCDHPNIVKVYGIYDQLGDKDKKETKRNGEDPANEDSDGEDEDDQNQMSIVMELCCGGSLEGRKLPLSEEQAKRIITQVLSALQCLHSNKQVAHRDLTLEHILLDQSDVGTCSVKLCDFGLAKNVRKGEKGAHAAGNPSYLSPEVIRSGYGSSQNYTKQADMWAVGVITYQLLSGESPFFAEDIHEITNKIVRCDYDFESRSWQHISSQARHFIQNLLQHDPKNRFTAEQALQHAWLKSE